MLNLPGEALPSGLLPSLPTLMMGKDTHFPDIIRGYPDISSGDSLESCVWSVYFLSLFLDVTGIQAFQYLLRDVIGIVGIQEVVKAGVADDEIVSLFLIIFFQEVVDGIAELEAVLFALAHQLGLQFVAQFLQVLLQFGYAVVLLFGSFGREVGVVLVFCLEFLFLLVQVVGFLVQRQADVLALLHHFLVHIDAEIVFGQKRVNLHIGNLQAGHAIGGSRIAAGGLLSGVAGSLGKHDDKRQSGQTVH